MTEREKVIKGLECCLDALIQSEHAIAENGVVMSSWQDRAKRIDAIREAIAFLKEQEPVKPRVGHDGWYRCGGCNNPIASGERVKHFYGHPWPKYCEECGRAVKWQ